MFYSKSTLNPRRFTRLPRLVGLSPWSAHALAPAVWISGPLNSLDPLILNPLSWAGCRAKVETFRAKSFKARVSIWRHLGDGHLDAHYVSVCRFGSTSEMAIWKHPIGSDNESPFGSNSEAAIWKLPF